MPQLHEQGICIRNEHGTKSEVSRASHRRSLPRGARECASIAMPEAEHGGRALVGMARSRVHPTMGVRRHSACGRRYILPCKAEGGVCGGRDNSPPPKIVCRCLRASVKLQASLPNEANLDTAKAAVSLDSCRAVNLLQDGDRELFTFAFLSLLALLVVEYQTLQVLLLLLVLDLRGARLYSQWRLRWHRKRSCLQQYVSPRSSRVTACPLTWFLLPRLVSRVKFITPGCPALSSAESACFLRAAGGSTAESHMASAVFLSTLRASADVSVSIFASSFAKSPSSSSDGPRISCGATWTTGSGDAARSSS
jgi:hypothetical protein